MGNHFKRPSKTDIHIRVPQVELAVNYDIPFLVLNFKPQYQQTCSPHYSP